MRYINEGLSELLFDSGEYGQLIIDSSCVDRRGKKDSLTEKFQENLDWHADMINFISELRRNGQRILVLREVLLELGNYLSQINSGRKGGDEQEREIYSKSFLRIMKSLQKQDLVFNPQEKQNAQKFQRYAEKAYSEIESRRGNFNNFLHRENSYGGKLRTDVKIAAAAFTLAGRGLTLALTKDAGLYRVINKMKDGYFANRQTLPAVDPMNVKVKNIIYL